MTRQEASLQELTSQEELDEVFERSRQRPQLVFKHSLTCPISSKAHKEMERYLEESPAAETDYWLIAVQRSRPLSKAFAERTGVRHESPQAVLVRDAEAVWNASHFAITLDTLTTALNGG